MRWFAAAAMLAHAGHDDSGEILGGIDATTAAVVVVSASLVAAGLYLVYAANAKRRDDGPAEVGGSGSGEDRRTQ